MSRNLPPVAGAARYSFCCDSGVWVVLMTDTEGFPSAVEGCATAAAAEKAADRWQKKENAAVTKARQSAECAR